MYNLNSLPLPPPRGRGRKIDKVFAGYAGKNLVKNNTLLVATWH